MRSRLVLDINLTSGRCMSLSHINTGSIINMLISKIRQIPAHKT